MNDKKTLLIKGMHCASCVAIIEDGLKREPGIFSANVNLVTEKVKLEYDREKINLAQIIQKISDLGYAAKEEETASIVSQREEGLKELDGQKNKLAVSLAIGLPLFYLTMGKMIGLPQPMLSMGINIIIQLMIAAAVIALNHRLFVGGIAQLFRLRPNMDSLIALGTSAAFIYSVALGAVAVKNGTMAGELYFESAAFILIFISLGKYLEAKTKGKTGEAVKKLIGLGAKSATVLSPTSFGAKEKTRETLNLSDYREIKMPIENVVVGDLVLVKPGEKIPVDGVIVSGYAGIDQQAITGESMPVEKTAGDEVIGATINKTGVLVIKASRVGKDTMLNQIIKIVEEAIGMKMPIQLLADKVSLYFVPGVLTIATLALTIWLLAGYPLSFALTAFVSVLIIACPCALGLATPTAVMVGTGLAAKRGILIKNGKALEIARKIDAVVFDKTGTLTKGEPAVTDIVSLTETPIRQPAGQILKSENEILQIAASAERNSEHPLAQAIVNETIKQKVELLPVTDFQAIIGKGVAAKVTKLAKKQSSDILLGNRGLMADSAATISAKTEKAISELENQGKTVMILAVDKTVIGLIAVSDTIKDFAKETIDQLHLMGKKVLIITGDNRRVGEAIAKELKIDEALAEVLPHQKAAKIKELQETGALVAMVGDGINDSPALAQADLGIALGSGTDIAIETGEIVLIKSDLRDVVKAIDISAKTYSKIKQNLFWAFFYNVILIPLAAGAFYPFLKVMLDPAFAALAMAFSSVSVVSNSLFLRGLRPEK
jgi:Cu+-exporting ATPase